MSRAPLPCRLSHYERHSAGEPVLQGAGSALRRRVAPTMRRTTEDRCLRGRVAPPGRQTKHAFAGGSAMRAGPRLVGGCAVRRLCLAGPRLVGGCAVRRLCLAGPRLVGGCAAAPCARGHASLVAARCAGYASRAATPRARLCHLVHGYASRAATPRARGHLVRGYASRAATPRAPARPRAAVPCGRVGSCAAMPRAQPPCGP